MKQRLNHHILHRKRRRIQKHKGIILWFFLANVVLAVMWGPTFIALTIIGPLKHLSSKVVWVAIISYYANMMGNLATASALYSSIVAHAAHETALDTAEALTEHEEQHT